MNVPGGRLGHLPRRSYRHEASYPTHLSPEAGQSIEHTTAAKMIPRMVPILYHNRLVVASEVRSSRWCYDRTFNLVSRCIEMNRKVYIEENQLTGQRVSGKHPGETGPNIP